MDMKFAYNDDLLIIKKNTIDIFHKYEQQYNESESGGILLGYAYSSYSEIFEITTPQKLDKFGRFFFIRAKKCAQKKINKAWKKSRGSLIYLGEWHTHSEEEPTPSQTDKNMIRKQLIETKMQIDFLYLIIVGQNDTYWVGKQNCYGLTRLDKK